MHVRQYIFIEDITRWREDINIISSGENEQRTYKSRGKTHAFFTRYIFFHIFTSESMENTSVLVYSKTPIISASTCPVLFEYLDIQVVRKFDLFYSGYYIIRR